MIRQILSTSFYLPYCTKYFKDQITTSRNLGGWGLGLSGIYARNSSFSTNRYFDVKARGGTTNKTKIAIVIGRRRRRRTCGIEQNNKMKTKQTSNALKR